jgi:Zn finger protein HypA/HybF involved in hydrogenase expression
MNIKYKVCDICGQKVAPRGMGGHKRLKHGIVVKTVLKYSGTQVGNVSTQVGNVSTQVGNVSTQVGNVSTHVIRPSDYVSVKASVVETKNVPLFDKSDKLVCWHCGSRLSFWNETGHGYFSNSEGAGWCDKCDKAMCTAFEYRSKNKY